jgi:hypothetical protein
MKRLVISVRRNQYMKHLALCAMIFSFVLIGGCKSAYKSLQPTQAPDNCIQKFRPSFTNNWYNATVDVIGKHISGLLLIKTMPDSSRRIVFTNEVGVTFFDFGFGKDGSFKVHQIIEQMDKKAVINLLRKDFELVMMQRIEDAKLQAYTRDGEIFYALPGKKETDYFITDKECSSLLRIEKASKRKKKTEVRIWNGNRQAPDSVHLKHFTFDMQIGLKKIQR